VEVRRSTRSSSQFRSPGEIEPAREATAPRAPRADDRDARPHPVLEADLEPAAEGDHEPGAEHRGQEGRRANLGAGRQHKEDAIDPAAGLVIQAPVGAQVRAGDPLGVIHARSAEVAQRVAGRLAAAWRILPEPVRRAPHVYARVDRHGVTGG